MTTLQRSYDRKVSPIIRRQVHRDHPVVGNSFGLPAGLSCPGMTPFCKGCYARHAENYAPASGALVRRNLATLQAHGDDIQALAAELTEMLQEFTNEFDRALRKGLVVESDRIFRWHWDGDFYSLAYAKAVAIVCRRHPEILHWAYTRSFEFVPALVNIANFKLYLSVDEYNRIAAEKLLRKYPSLLVAACATTQAAAQKVTVRKTVVCPENVKRLPLVVAMSGKRTDKIEVGDDARGACASCRLCVDGTHDVSFAVLHR